MAIRNVKIIAIVDSFRTNAKIQNTEIYSPINNRKQKKEHNNNKLNRQ